MINKKIFFWPHTTNAKIASYRLRCKLIANELIKIYGANIVNRQHKVDKI